MRGLIGCTGLVGSNLLLQGTFTHSYHSRNIHEIRSQQFEEIICAGVSGFKWEVNRNPQRDRERIQLLLDCLAEVTAERFILISTIDVYGEIGSGRDESYDPTNDSTHAYGKHRQEVERWVRRRFPHALIVRLAGIYGQNLKKNLVFDLLHRNALQLIDPASVFQWYSLHRLQADIDIALQAGLKVVNLFPEPLATADLIQTFFNSIYEIQGENVILRGGSPHPSAPQRFSQRYDLRTQFGSLFQAPGNYLQTLSQVKQDLGKFVEAYPRQSAH